MAKRKSKYKVTPIEAQRRRLDALERWFQFVNDEREITPENFSNELLFPTAWGLGRGRSSGGTAPAGQREVEEIRMQIADGLKALADKGSWVIPGALLGRLNIVISQLGTALEGPAHARALAGISGLLQDEEWRVGRCLWCGKLFVKKKRAEYCSLRCSQRMRTKRSRDPRWPRKEAHARKRGLPAEQIDAKPNAGATLHPEGK